MAEKIVFLILFLWRIQEGISGECYITGKSPRLPKVGLGFCSRVFPFENCCVPVYDEEIRGYYDGLLQTSSLCGSTSTHSTRALQYLFCYACSDQQPRYLINEGIQYSDDDPSLNYTLYSIVICENLIRLLYPENFDDCGLVVPAARGDNCAGDDTVRPSDYWGSGEDGALNFLNDEAGGKPPFFSDDDNVKYRVIIDYTNGDNCYKSSGFHLSRQHWFLPLLLSILATLVLSS